MSIQYPGFNTSEFLSCVKETLFISAFGRIDEGISWLFLKAEDEYC